MHLKQKGSATPDRPLLINQKSNWKNCLPFLRIKQPLKYFCRFRGIDRDMNVLGVRAGRFNLVPLAQILLAQPYHHGNIPVQSRLVLAIPEQLFALTSFLFQIGRKTQFIFILYRIVKCVCMHTKQARHRNAGALSPQHRIYLTPVDNCLRSCHSIVVRMKDSQCFRKSSRIKYGSGLISYGALTPDW